MMHSLLAAVTNFTGPIIPTGTLQTCAAGFGGLTQIVGGALGIMISLGVLISVMVLAYGGFLLVLNPINAENRSKARTVLLNAAIGLVLTLAAWLLINTLLTVLGVGGIAGATTKIFTGSNNPCLPTVTQKTINGGGGATNNNGVNGSGGSGGCPSGQSCQSTNLCGPVQTTCGSNTCTQNQVCSADGTTCVAAQSCTYSSGSGAGGQVAQNVCAAAQAAEAIPMSSANAPGTNGGQYACAWAVGQVVQQAGYSGFSTNVGQLESALTGGRGTVESQSDAVCGDIVVEAGDHHVGICLNSGCSSVISNSSSHATFSWVSGPDFAPSYHDGIGRFYRLNN